MPWYELTRWLAYRSIKHPAMRPYVSTLPLGFSFAATALYLLLPVKPSLTASGGLLSNILTLLAVLPGFFIAALAAVATFNRPEMDEEMPAPCPTIAIYRGGEWLDVKSYAADVPDVPVLLSLRAEPARRRAVHRRSDDRPIRQEHPCHYKSRRLEGRRHFRLACPLHLCPVLGVR